MKLCLRRIYCPNCQRLVRCQEQTANGILRLVCPRCKQPIRLKTPSGWR